MLKILFRSVELHQSNQRQFWFVPHILTYLFEYLFLPLFHPKLLRNLETIQNTNVQNLFPAFSQVPPSCGENTLVLQIKCPIILSRPAT